MSKIRPSSNEFLDLVLFFGLDCHDCHTRSSAAAGPWPKWMYGTVRGKCGVPRGVCGCQKPSQFKINTHFNPHLLQKFQTIDTPSYPSRPEKLPGYVIGPCIFEDIIININIVSLSYAAQPGVKASGEEFAFREFIKMFPSSTYKKETISTEICVCLWTRLYTPNTIY